MNPEYGWLPHLLQTADALFPTGSYAHSLGFEEAVRLGLAQNESGLKSFLDLNVVPALIHQELPYLRFAFEAAIAADWEALCGIDAEVHAAKPARETREASVQIGGRRLRALSKIVASPLLDEFDRRIAGDEAFGHHCVVWGLQAVIESVPLNAALASYFYLSIASVCSAALKLIRIGQDGCQRVLRQVLVENSSAVELSLSVERAGAGWFNPLLEIASMRHEHAAERLFIS